MVGFRMHRTTQAMQLTGHRSVRSRKEKAAIMTQELATVFEKGIADHPQDWHMLQRVFSSDLDPRRLPAANSGINQVVNSAGSPAGSPTDSSADSAAGLSAGSCEASGITGR